MLKKRINQKFIKILFWTYTLIILLLCVLPINGSNSSLNNIFFVNIRGDYWVHLLLFIPWMLLGKLYTGISFQKSAGKTIFYIAIGLIFASASEIIQYFLPYRSFNVNDLIANGIGIGIGMIFFIK